jgi:cytochrome c-type biogenesis protein CcmH
VNPTLAFVAVAAGLVGLALVFVLPALLRPSGNRPVSRARLNAGIYQQQLADVERDRALGLIGDTEAARAADELRGRLLADVDPDPAVVRGYGRAAALAVAAALPLGAILLYLVVGTPRALERSPSSGVQAEANGASIEALEAHVGNRPDDARAWVLLARAKMQRDAFAAAVDAYRQGLARSQKVARDAGVLCEYADALAMAQGGSLQGQPAELVAQALALDGRHPQALEMAGSAAFERGDYSNAVAHWQKLLEQLQPDSERHRELAMAIEFARRKAGAVSRG